MKATLAEAYLGIGEAEKGQTFLEAAKQANIAAPTLDPSGTLTRPSGHTAVAGWMIETTEAQLTRLRDLLAKSPLYRIH